MHFLHHSQSAGGLDTPPVVPRPIDILCSWCVTEAPLTCVLHQLLSRHFHRLVSSPVCCEHCCVCASWVVVQTRVAGQCRAGAFCGILLLSGLSQWLEPAYNLPLLYASFGASAVLIFGVISSPLAQPRNFVGKCIWSGVCIRNFHVTACVCASLINANSACSR